MTKTEFIYEVAGKSGLTKKDTEKAVKAFCEVVTEQLAKGEKIQLVGFGTFEVAERAEREGVNPSTKEKILIKAAKIPKWKPSKSLKDSVNAAL